MLSQLPAKKKRVLGFDGSATCKAASVCPQPMLAKMVAGLRNDLLEEVVRHFDELMVA